MKIAVIVGHDPASPGAFSHWLHTSEYMYNAEVATYLATIADIYKRPKGGGYKTQMAALANILNPQNYDLVVELHFNAFNKRANGCEAVIFKGSATGRKVGLAFCEQICQGYGTTNRGVKEVGADGERGYWFLKYMKAPALILEPFFGDAEESLKFENPGKYAEHLKKILCG